MEVSSSSVKGHMKWGYVRWCTHQNGIKEIRYKCTMHMKFSLHLMVHLEVLPYLLPLSRNLRGLQTRRDDA